jgi:cobalamin biosynthetic protein CobC
MGFFTAGTEANRDGVDVLAYHGGGLDAARRRFPTAPEPWLDLSTGINPIPYPIGALSEAAWTRLPEAGAIAALEAAAAQAYGLGADAAIVAAPGTQALIQFLPRLIPAKKVAILGFTYGEHGLVWRASGAEVTICDDLESPAQADVAVVVNPNNPDGRRVAAPDLLALARKMATQGKNLIVDEAFIDVLPPEASLAPHLPQPGLVVLRSFGKTYGLAGLRLGFALGGAEIVEKWRAALGPWAVSGAAVEIGQRAFADAAWLAASAARLDADGARLDALLRRAGFEMIGGTPLFRLTRHKQAPAFFARLGAAGILTRPFAAQAEWLRFGVPHGDADFSRLAAALLSP